MINKININMLRLMLYSKQNINIYKYILQQAKSRITEMDLLHDLYLHHIDKNIIPTNKTVKNYLINIVNKKSFGELIIEDEDFVLNTEECNSTNIDLKLYIEDILNHLSERERYVVKLKFFNNLTLKEIAEKMKIKPQSVHSILSKALEKLKSVVDME